MQLQSSINHGVLARKKATRVDLELRLWRYDESRARVHG